MIRKSIIALLSLFAVLSVLLIPVSFRKQDSIYETIRNCFHDASFFEFVLTNETVGVFGSDSADLGRWISIGPSTSIRALLGAKEGRGIVAIAIPCRTSAPAARFPATSRSLLGFHFSHHPPTRDLLSKTPESEMTTYQLYRHQQWVRTSNSDLYAISAPLAGCALIFAAFPLYSFITGPLRTRHRRRRGLCVQCGYNLAGNTTSICPECGTSFATTIVESPRRCEGV